MIMDGLTRRCRSSPAGLRGRRSQEPTVHRGGEPPRPRGSTMPTALIVDDDPDIRFVVRLQIQHGGAGLEVVGEAATGQEAIQQWRDTTPDVIVLDNQMPDMTGMEVAEVILGERPGQAIIIFTAIAEAVEARAATARGI